MTRQLQKSPEKPGDENPRQKSAIRMDLLRRECAKPAYAVCISPNKHKRKARQSAGLFYFGGALAAFFLFSLCPCIPLPPRLSADRTAHRLLLKPLFPKEKLFSFCKYKLIAAIPADQHLILHLFFLHFSAPPILSDTQESACLRSARTRHFCRTRCRCHAQ